MFYWIENFVVLSVLIVLVVEIFNFKKSTMRLKAKKEPAVRDINWVCRNILREHI